MKDFKRIIIAPSNDAPWVSPKDVLDYLQSIERTIGFVDDYLTVKNNHSMVVIKNNEIIKFQGKSIEHFQETFLDSVADASGTSFLICNN